MAESRPMDVGVRKFFTKGSSQKDRIAVYYAKNGLQETDAFLADAVTASRSGLDLHFAVRNAKFQGAHVAKAH